MGGAWRKKNCTANPFDRPRLMGIENLNASISDQTISWFRGCARSLNELKPIRHQFLLPIYAKMHNAPMATGDTSRLNTCPHQDVNKKRSSPYGRVGTSRPTWRGRAVDPDGSRADSKTRMTPLLLLYFSFFFAYSGGAGAGEMASGLCKYSLPRRRPEVNNRRFFSLTYIARPR